MIIRKLFGDKIGKFYIDNFDYKLAQKEILKSIFSNVVVLRCECLEFDKKYEYYACSDLFDVITEGQQIPEYNIVISTSLIRDKIIHNVKFGRRK